MSVSHDDIITLALELSRHLRRQMIEQKSTKGSLNFVRSHALSFLKDHEHMTMKQFATCMQISPSSATAFVDRLMEHGWVMRKADSQNRKVVHIALTKKGCKMLAKHQQDKRAFLVHLLQLLPAVDRKHLQRILSTLLEKTRTGSHSVSSES